MSEGIANGRPAGKLEVLDVHRSYSGVPVVKGVSFTLEPGMICGYLGPNGSGKTTTVKMLTGLLPPSRGTIRFDGRDIAEFPDEYKNRFGYVPEEPFLYRHLSGYEYLELVGGLRGMPAKTIRDKAKGALSVFGLADSGESAIDTYSKGMKQKVLIAAALLHDPDLLIFDEPLSGLDVTAVLIMRHLFDALGRRGKIVLLSSHVLEIVEKVCSRVIVIYRGKVVADDEVSRMRQLMRLPSLEQIFAELTEQQDLERRAQELVELMAS